MNKTDSKPMLVAHVVILRYHQGHLEGLFIDDPRDIENREWTLPSVPLMRGETPHQTLSRVFGKGDARDAIQFAELGSFWPVNEGEDDWSVGLAFLGLVKPDHEVQLADQASRALWHPLSKRPDLKWNSADILDAGVKHLRQRINVDTYPLTLLPVKFRTKQARQLYSQILDQPVAPRPFKAWLRRRQAVTRKGPATFSRNDTLKHDWLLD